MTLVERRTEAESNLQKAREESAIWTQRVIYYSGQVEMLITLLNDELKQMENGLDVKVAEVVK